MVRKANLIQIFNSMSKEFFVKISVLKHYWPWILYLLAGTGNIIELHRTEELYVDTSGSSWKEWDHGWEKQLGLLVSEMGVNAVVLEMTVSHDPANSSQHVIEVRSVLELFAFCVFVIILNVLCSITKRVEFQLDQPKWGVGSRWPYLMGPNDPMIRNYTHLMTTVAIALGADPQVARRDMQVFWRIILCLAILYTSSYRQGSDDTRQIPVLLDLTINWREQTNLVI